MVVLTENLVLSKTRSDSLAHVKHLNLWGNDLTDVGLLKKMPHVEVVSLSVNRISSLEDFQHCSTLQELYLRKNEVSSVEEVQWLKNLKSLRVLWLSENPCAEQANYRLYVVKCLPHLAKLDNTEITDEERTLANKLQINFRELPSSQENQLSNNNARRPASTPFTDDKRNIQSKQEPNKSRMNWKQPQQEQIHENIRAAAMETNSKIPRSPPIARSNSANPPTARNASPIWDQPKKDKSNIVSAVMSLLEELDDSNLIFVKSEIDRKLKNRH